MKKKKQPKQNYNEKSSFSTEEMVHSINLAIVGGGKACRFFLEILNDELFTFLNINIVGVCDINPEAEGLILAKELGIYTTNDFQEFFKIEDLDSIIELTGSRKVLLEIIRLRPKGVGVIEHNIGRLMRRLFEVNQSLKTTEQQLVQKKMFSDFLIQQSTAAIVILNTDFTIAETNEAYLKAVNKPKEEVIGTHCYRVSHGLDVPCSSSRPEMKCPVVETLRTGISAHVIHEHPEPEGHSTYCNIVTYPLKNEEGEIDRVIEVWSDITKEFTGRWDERVQELKSDLQKLVQEDRMISLGKLAASCAHEINNPIQGLLTFSGLMQDILAEGKPSSKDWEQFKKHLSFMSRELERCGNIISGLLSFSRKSLIEYKNIDLIEIIQNVINLTQHTMKLRNIDLTLQLPSGLIMLQGNDSQLQQCFLNLVFNAIEAMPEGGQLRITSKLDKINKSVRIEIQDTGHGIPKESLDHIFDPFFTTKGLGEGTGLGLSIVYGVVKNHKGKIKIDSTLGKGTSFVLTFPTV